MKALTLWQPHAGLIRLGLKTIETRGWRTEYRGPLAIHAGKKFDDEYWEVACAEKIVPFEEDDEVPECRIHGAIICVVDLVDCRPMVRADEGSARCSCPYPGEPMKYAWVLGNVRVCDWPIPAVGHQLLWETDLVDINGRKFEACLSPAAVPAPAPAVDSKQLRIPGME